MNNYCMIQNSKTFAFSAENPTMSIWVLMETEVSFRLMVMFCRFCKTLPKRSESVLAVSMRGKDNNKFQELQFKITAKPGNSTLYPKLNP